MKESIFAVSSYAMKAIDDLSKTYFWIDTEFTSLDLDVAELLQVSIVATDANLNRVLSPDQDLNIYTRLGDDAQLSPWVAENLSELIAICRSDEALSLAEARSAIGRWLISNFGEQRADISMRPIIAGNSLFCDLSLIRRFVPELIDFANYRILDVSSWKVHIRNTSIVEPFDKDSVEAIESNLNWMLAGGGREHDAYFDVQASIAELGYYMKALRGRMGGR